MGIGMLTAGLILAIMIIPFMAAVMRDVFETVPSSLRESAYALGCTTWEVVWRVVLPYTRAGVIGGVILGLGRALGETMAVTFVIGNAHEINASLFMPGNTISSTLANEFTEAVTPIYTSSLLALGLILFILTFLVLVVARADAVEDARARWGADVTLYARRRLVNRDRALAVGPRDRCSGCSGSAGCSGRCSPTGCAGSTRGLFVESTPPPGSQGGLANAIVGSAILTLAGVAIGAPAGVLAGTYLAEFGRTSRLGAAVRFVNDILLSAPSIIIGVFVYALIVLTHRALLGMGGRGRAGADRAAGRGAHHREHDASGSRQPARGRRRAGCADVEDHAARRLSQRPARHPDRRAAGHGAHQRRDRAAAVHRAQQPVLEHRHEPAVSRTCRR